MHIPSAMLQGALCPVTASVSALGLSVVTLIASRVKERPTASWFGSAAALIFVLQMFNFPVQYGTSGHLLGGVLASALLGIPFGVLAVALVATLQALLFSDGGLSVLGANIFNMAILGAGLGGLVRILLIRASVKDTAATALAAWISVLAAAFACVVELALSGNAKDFSLILVSMMSVHALIGLGEAFLTVGLLYVLGTASCAQTQSRKSWTIFGGSLALSTLSPLACPWPDGLEWVAEKYGLIHQMTPAFASPMPDYSILAVASPFWSTAGAGMIGTLAVYFLGAALVGMNPKKA